MTERLLQFIWQFQYFNKSALSTTDEEVVTVQYQGEFNTNQGPDFLNAKIKIGNKTWAGSVELHLHHSDWKKHQHQHDKNYNNVILHVVWVQDESPNQMQHITQKGATIPTLELNGRVPLILLQRYEMLMNEATFIPCEKLIGSVKAITLSSWKDRLLVERMLRKSIVITQFLQENNYHWEETFWWLLARNFGIKVNADAFETIARSLPINILAKHKNQVHQLEALLLGQAGLLEEEFLEDYPKLLRKEYQFLKAKYNLKATNSPVYFLRMRPSNFPTIRLAQLAQMVMASSHLFSKIKEADSVLTIKQLLNVTANDYWHYHYQLGEQTAFKEKKIGAAMIDNIIINTICPILFAYGSYHQLSKFKERSINWLEELKPEKNLITKGFVNIGVSNRHANDSQSLIELKNEYCNKKKCLDCGIGTTFLKTQDTETA